MVLPVQTTFRNLEPSAGIQRLVEEEATGLEAYDERIQSCHVMVEVPHEHRRHGRHVHVRIVLVVPGGEIVVRHEPAVVVREPEVGEVLKRHEVQPEHRYVAVAIRDAFHTTRRRLQDYARRRRGDVKQHAAQAHGRVSSLHPDYGFLQTPEGIEIYFHRNSVLDGAFHDLAVGTEVRFVEEEGDEGPQASTVAVVGRVPAGAASPQDPAAGAG